MKASVTMNKNPVMMALNAYAKKNDKEFLVNMLIKDDPNCEQSWLRKKARAFLITEIIKK